jgi:3'-phosphoadenosine 5'-phosphosulfate sulfotransferase (PAPS reductase)/FAD synthetase
MSGYQELLESGNLAIADAAMKCEAVFSSHEKAIVSVSGGADSDVVIDILERVSKNTPIDLTYIWFNTGLEYNATKRHLRYLEDRYGVKIQRERAIKPIPKTNIENGQPFLNKYVSEQITRLQRHGFHWGPEPFEELWAMYPQCKASLRWWTNDFMREHGTNSPTRYDIARNKFLREFMLENPPTFKVGSKCCKYAKKDVLKHYLKGKDYDLIINGVRRSEGGIRSTAYKQCFDQANKTYGIDVYRPIFWFVKQDRQFYEEKFGIRHSDCYEVYGLDRTGCVGCPFGRYFEHEIEACESYEPNLAKAVKNIFRDSYEYTRQFHEFREEMRARESGQMRLSFE